MTARDEFLTKWAELHPPKPKPVVIGLYSSVMASGKSEVSRALGEFYHFQTVKFAGPLKDMARGLLKGMGIDPDTIERMVEGDLKEEPIPGFETVTARHIMQTLGTDWGREAIDLDLWTKVALKRITGLLDQGISVVVDDMRFPNEFDAIKALGGYTVRIIRPNAQLQGSARYEGKLDNKPFDHMLHNDASLDILRGRVIAMADHAFHRSHG